MSFPYICRRFVIALMTWPRSPVTLLKRMQAGESVSLTEKACLKLREHCWPGNVRELENVMQRALILRTGQDVDEQDVYFEDVPKPQPAVSPPGPAPMAMQPSKTERYWVRD